MEQARRKGAYAELRCADLGDPTAVRARVRVRVKV